MRRPGKAPGNRPSGRSRVHVLIEGEVTEREYLEGLRGYLGISAKLLRIDDDNAKDVEGLIQLAKLERDGTHIERGKPIPKRRAESFDEWWIVCDTETAPEDVDKVKRELAEDARKAAAKGRGAIRLFASCPSFEVWLLCHCTSKIARFQDAAACVRELGKPRGGGSAYLPGYSERNKHVRHFLDEGLLEHIDYAHVSLAAARASRSTGQGDDERVECAITHIDKLIAHMNELASPGNELMADDNPTPFRSGRRT